MEFNRILKPLAFVSVFSLGACAPLPMKQETGQLNLNYTSSFPAATSTNKVIGIVSPQYEEKFTAYTPISSQRVGFKAAYYYQQQYREQVKTAFDNTFLSIISNKGFSTKGPYTSFDDVTFIDKQGMYLSVVPSLTFDIVQTSTGSKCLPSYCEETGQIEIAGEMMLKVIEPLTGQTMLNKRINLRDFNISKPYIKQWSINANNDLIGLAISQIGKPAALQDNSDKALVDILNEFYEKTSTKIETYLSREELLSMNQDVQHLKNMKRY